MVFCVCLWMLIIFSAFCLASPCVLWSPIEIKCEQYVIFLLLFSENAKLPITLIPLYLVFVSLIGSDTKLDQVCSGRRRLLPLITRTLVQTNKNRRFLDQSVWLIWFLSNLEWLLILEEDTDFPKEYKALILTILSMINVILEKYESVKAWIHSTLQYRKWQTKQKQTLCSLNEWLL